MATSAAFSKTFDWRVDSPQARAETFTAYHGETVKFNPIFAGLASNIVAKAIYYTTNGIASIEDGSADWFKTDGLVFHPTNDCGLASYRFFLRGIDPEGVNYTANGLLRMLPSPGFEPAVLPLPVKTLDFDLTEVLNAPYYTKAEADARIVELAPTPDLSGYATAQVLADEVTSARRAATNYTDSVATSLRGEIASAAPGDYAAVSNRAMSALQSYSETDPTVPEWARNPTKPTYAAADVGAADAASFAAVSNDVAAISATLNAENARFVSTNYNSSVHLAEASVEVKVDGSWLVIWREMARWNWFLGEYLPTNYYDKAALDDAFDGKADRAWGFYDPMTGNYAPDDCIWLSAPRVYVCAGMSYQRVADTRGYWVLTSNGMVADLSGTTNGYFRISDSDGETQFEIVKGDKQTLGAKATVMSHEPVMGVTHYFTSYAVTNAVSAPTAAFSRSLDTVAWISEYDPLCPCNVEWTQSGAAEWTCEWWPKSDEPTVFMMVQYERGGETYINNVAPVSMQYIYLGGVKYSLGTATISGNTVLTLTVAP